MKIMYDAVTAANIPRNASYAAYYTDGLYANHGAVRAQCPNATLLSITVRGGVADCCDSETGDLTVDQTIAWVEWRLRDGAWRPCVYANEDRWNNLGLKAALARYGPRIRRWVANYDNVAIIPAGFDAKQYKTGNIDTSVIADNFFHPSPPPPPKDPHHYLWFFNTAFKSPWGPLNERALVKAYDEKRKHPVLHARALHNLRIKLRWLANRLTMYEGSHAWYRFNRWWRYHQLLQRADGRRFV